MYKNLDRFGPKVTQQAAPKGPDPLEVALNRITELEADNKELAMLLDSREQDIKDLESKKPALMKKPAAKKKTKKVATEDFIKEEEAE